MTGTGIQSDPYIITSAEELYEISSLGDGDTYFRLGSDIDFNGTPYAEKFEPIPVKFRELDGNGHCIRNIYINTLSSASVFNVIRNSNGAQTAIKNLTLENVSIMASYVNLFTSGSGSNVVNLYGCTLLLDLSQNVAISSNSSYGSLICNSYVTVNYELCTVSIKALMRNPFPLISRANFYRSHLCLDLDIISGLSSYVQSVAVFDNSKLTDSYLTGSISYRDSGDVNYFQIANYLCVAQNFYMAIELVGRSMFYCDMSTKTDCFFDSELMNGAVHNQYNSSNCNKFHALTTAQCKDADYLNSIGFICAGDSP